MAGQGVAKSPRFRHTTGNHRARAERKRRVREVEELLYSLDEFEDDDQ
jgi:hypothetical protein